MTNKRAFVFIEQRGHQINYFNENICLIHTHTHTHDKQV